ncbi:MAG: radical SAM protein [Firmicutes bacterium]|nr:radical SAM protein [Bacillota bacterium]
MKKQHLFGPVPSRRLGLSLGIDLVPFKTCSLNCVYCECGRTTDLTMTRKEYVPVAAVLAELDHYLKSDPELDYITFAGSGEPMLHEHIDRVVDHIKERYPQYPLCLLTNGTLFSSARARDQINQIDLIVPSLDAASEEVFRKLNRPHPDLDCKDVISGLVSLRHEYRGEICMEVFIVPGLNDTDEELAAIKKALEKINPDRIQLGTLDRPGTEAWVKEAAPNRMLEIAEQLGCEAELIEEEPSLAKTPAFDTGYADTILQTLQRRPCTVEDLSRIIGARPAEVQKYLRQLLSAGLVEMERQKRGVFIRIKGH